MAYIVNQYGAIFMKSSLESRLSTSIITGFNIISDLYNAGAKKSDIETFSNALMNNTSLEIVMKIKAQTWMFIVLPQESNRSIVISVPVSTTARGTFENMTSTILSFIFACLLAFVLIFWIIGGYYKKNQEIVEEQTKIRAKSEFMDKMSHDIRTPLNAIIGLLELAQTSEDDKEVLDDYISKARISSGYLVSIINDVLDLSKIESGKIDIVNRPFSMEEFLKNIKDMEDNVAKDKKIDFRIITKDPIEEDYIGDELRIKQCVINLLSNALKFTNDNGTVTLTFERGEIDSDNKVVATFIVEDNGIGMSEEFQKKMFTPFEQERSSLISSTAGSGLGLTIIQNLINLMGGTLDVKSKIGEGSKFVMCLPLEVTKKSDVNIKHNYEALSVAFKGISILLVEDSQLNRKVEKTVLEKIGLTVSEAFNGKMAVDMFNESKEGSFDLIFMDINMPIMGGIEATRTIRNLPRADAQSVVIIAQSANAYQEDKKDSLAAGMQDYLSKPIQTSQIVDTINKYVKKGEKHE